MFIEVSHAFSLEFGRKRLSDTDLLSLVAEAEEHIEPAKAPVGFVRNEES